jgi:hypothetical protein
MWVARNKNGKFRLFETPPRRYHDGPKLPAELIGFNDAVSVGDGEDEYSFWAVQKYYNSNIIEGKEYGYRIMTEGTEDEHPVWFEYVPECIKDMTWKDEPVEVEIRIKKRK